MKINILFFLLATVSLYSQDAIPDASGGKSKFTNTYKYYRIVNDNSDTGWLTLKNEFTFNIGSKYNIKTSDAFGRTHTYYCLGKTEEFQLGGKSGWKNYYSIEGKGRIEFFVLRIGTIIRNEDLIAVYTNVPSFFSDDFFY